VHEYECSRKYKRNFKAHITLNGKDRENYQEPCSLNRFCNKTSIQVEEVLLERAV